MTLQLAATATGLLLLVALVYAGSCWAFPFATCRVCDGDGKRRSGANRRHFRPCWWCKGSGRRLRIGRRVHNAIQRRRKEAQ